jgi:hypothetical protein
MLITWHTRWKECGIRQCWPNSLPMGPRRPGTITSGAIYCGLVITLVITLMFLSKLSSVIRSLVW